jgi:transposase
MTRGDLTDTEWERIAPLLPSSQGRRGGQWLDHRQMMNGILWILRTGAQWEDLPLRYGPRSTAHDRLRRSEREGVWERVLRALQRDADQAGDLHWTVVSVDGTIVRAHQHAAGARHSPAHSDREESGEKGGRGSRRRGARPQSRRVEHQAAPRLRRARPAAGGASDRRATAREHAIGGGLEWHSGAPPAGPTSTTAGNDGLGQRV